MFIISAGSQPSHVVNHSSNTEQKTVVQTLYFFLSKSDMYVQHTSETLPASISIECIKCDLDKYVTELQDRSSLQENTVLTKTPELLATDECFFPNITPVAQELFVVPSSQA